MVDVVITCDRMAGRYWWLDVEISSRGAQRLPSLTGGTGGCSSAAPAGAYRRYCSAILFGDTVRLYCEEVCAAVCARRCARGEPWRCARGEPWRCARRGARDEPWRAVASRDEPWRAW